MKTRFQLIQFILPTFLFAIVVGAYGDDPAKPAPRKDCFFGLHFDLHPHEFDTELGKDTTEENVAALLDRVKPDFVQYDCKGHRGYCGYPSKVGSPSPGIVNDALAIWRKATREHGVGLYIHYSGVWDTRALELHPEWARMNADGGRDKEKTSVFGPYADELLIPQLSEAVTNYQLDGVWVDGECWAVELDYSPAALEAWKKETGYTEAPKKSGEPHWLEWKDFNRKHFENYLTHWAEELHKRNPGVQVTSNWMYTTLAPKPIVAPLDYLSGDYSPGDSVDTARLDARFLASAGMPWDLMAWGFDKGGEQGWSWKTAIHLMQEASVVLMQGGGFQIYYQPTRAGYVPQPIIDITGQVADFCRARQAVSHKSTSVPQAALLLSYESFKERSNRVFSGGDYDGLKGALFALTEMQYSVDVLAEHQLLPRLSEYPLVALPDTFKLTDEFKNALLDYVRNGGSLLLMSSESAQLFQDQLGVQFEGDSQPISAELGTKSGVVNATGKWQKVKPGQAQIVGTRYETRDVRRAGEPAATVADFGKGKIGAIYGPFCDAYFQTHHPWLREFLQPVVEKLFPKPAVKIEAPSTVEIALRKTKDGRLALHLLNRANMPLGAYRAIDCVPDSGPVRVTLAVPQAPKKVEWIPEGGKIEWNYKDGQLTFEIPNIRIHGVAAIE